MKKLYLILIALCLICGCKKNYVHDVNIVMEKGNVYRQVLNHPFVDPGVYGVDWMNKHLPVETDLSALDINKTGSYMVKYSATDEYGNVGTAEREVIVYNELEYLNGNWSFYKYDLTSGALDTIYIETLFASDTLNRMFSFTRFSNYDNSPVLAHIQANLITIDSLEYNVGADQNTDIWFYGQGIEMSNNRLEFGYGEIKGSTTSLYTALVTRE
jgi:hypothetical protein